ncbi:hypothetical protein MRX96_009446 [Rhipicephalus microplus]
MTILRKSVVLPCARKRHVFRRCLPLVCFVPLAVLTLRIFTKNLERRQEIMNARFLEEMKLLTDVPAKQENTQRASCPPSYRRYVVLDSDVTSVSSRLTLNRTEAPVPGESATVTVDISRVTYDTIRIRIWDRTRREFVPPVPAIEEEFSGASQTSACTARLSSDHVLFVVAKDTGRVISEFDLPRLYYTERDKLVTLRPRDRFAYGIRSAPSVRPFLDIGAQSARHLFYRGQGVSAKGRGYAYLADHPFLLLAPASDGPAHGLYLHNGNEIELVTSSRGSLTFRVNGGHFDFFLFCGPTPQSVLEQYQALVGRPSMPSVHTLRNPMPSDGPVKLADVVTSAHLARAVNRLGLYKIQRNLTINITHEVVIRDSKGKQPYQCYDKPNKVVYFVDFTHPMAQQHWDAMLQQSNLSEVLNTTVDYLLLEKPRCTISGPAMLDAPAQGATTAGQIRGSARMHLSTFADLRNAYPYMLAQMTHRYETTMTYTRPKLLSDATFAGQGKWSGYWRAGAPRTWQELGDTLAEMLTFGMLGVQMYGVGACKLADVASESEAELCLRWFSLSTFFPVHQSLGKGTTAIQRRVTTQALKATALRRFLLPYAYTQMVKAARGGGTLSRPTYIDFPGDPKTHAHPKQFMFGPSLLVAPQMEAASTLLEVYFPAAQCSSTDIHLIVSPDSSDYAYGELVIDDGVRPGTFLTGRYSMFHFSYMKGILTGHCSSCKWSATLRAATVFGVPGPGPARVVLNERPLKFAYARETLYLFDIGHKLRQPFAITVARV